MTVETRTTKISHVGEGFPHIRTFAFNFKVLSTGDLRVLRRLNGVVTPESSFTVDGLGMASASVTISSGLASGEDLLIKRGLDLSQVVNLRNRLTIDTNAHEDALDLLAMANIQQQEELDRAPKFGEFSGVTGVDIDDPIDGTYLQWVWTGSKFKIQNSSASVPSLTMRSSTQNPTTSDIANGSWGIWKNTIANSVKLWVNDSGVMKSVALA